MSENRENRLILNGQPTIEGAGVHLNRIFGYSEAPRFDPFLMLDDFRSDTPAHYRKGFPWHPHRGIETITYVLKGDVEHGDSLGNAGVISAGDVQWMTAGSGIIHQEMPKGDTHGAMHGFQLWVNLPAVRKMTAPRYRGLTADKIPELELPNGIKIKVVAGLIDGTQGPLDDIAIDPEFLDCSVPAGERFIHKTDPAYTAFIYVIGGKGQTNDHAIGNGTLVLFEEGEQLVLSAAEEPLRFLLMTGKPLNEPVAWQGPIVMNSQAELETAFREYREGTFIKQQ